MSQIPAPLLSRQTAAAVVVFAVLGIAAAAATILGPIDGSVLWPVVVRQLVVTAQAVVLALAVFLIWRTLAPRTRAAAVGALAGVAGLLLFALVQLASIVVATPWGVLPVVIGLEVTALVAAVLIIPGLLALTFALRRRGAWRGATVVTPAVLGLLLIPIGVTQVLHGPIAIPYAVWSLASLGLVTGLRSPRSLPVSSAPVAQQGAARV